MTNFHIFGQTKQCHFEGYWMRNVLVRTFELIFSVCSEYYLENNNEEIILYSLENFYRLIGSWIIIFDITYSLIYSYLEGLWRTMNPELRWEKKISHYADDSVIFAESLEGLQGLMSRIKGCSQLNGLDIKINETKLY